MSDTADTAEAPTRPRRDKMHYLYLAVVGAVLAGAAVGLAAPDFAQELKPVGTAFVDLIKMMISPIIFCTIVLGIGSVAKAAKVGSVGLVTIGYFLVMSTFALAIGLAVGNVLHPGDGLHLDPSSVDSAHEQAEGGEGTTDFLLGIIPDTLVSALTGDEVPQALLVALLTGFALQGLGPAGEPIREDGAPRGEPPGRRHRRPDRVLLQPGRHRDLPDDGEEGRPVSPAEV